MGGKFLRFVIQIKMEEYILLLLAFASITSVLSSNRGMEKYIVYMGHNREAEPQVLTSSHHEILTSTKKSKEAATASLVHSYKHGLNGFSAFLTAQEADAIAELPGVVKVFRSRKVDIHTTRSWDFLASLGGHHSAVGHLNLSSSDVIIGVLDTGVWPESESFDDAGMTPVPKRWKGVCDNSKVTSDLHKIHCNKKIIGARSYGYREVGRRYQNARDEVGHGTHTASTIAGSLVREASFLGYGRGNARGGYPSARLAIYRVCVLHCESDNVLAAFDDAIHDGVDILSLSLGGTGLAFDEDHIAIGSFHAMQRGILVSCSAGNSGPDLQTLFNTAPWIVTVGASTIDRQFAVEIKLGHGNSSRTVKGVALNPNLAKESKLIYGGDASSRSDRRGEARFCAGDTLNGHKVRGKIVLCRSKPGSGIQKSLRRLGAAGVIVDSESTEAWFFLNLPGATVSEGVLDELIAYANSSSDATATITVARTILHASPSPVIAHFSSRGPARTGNILKPDLVAPGVDILAAWSPEVAVNDFGTPVYTHYNIISGTSMSCPHVTAAAAFVKSKHPSWSTAAIKSALMTTARFLDNTKNPIRDFDGKKASPFAMGAGQIDPVAALSPGLIYDIAPDDYTKFLCAMNFTSEQLELMTGKVPTCSPLDGYLDLNYPSIAIPFSRFAATNSTLLYRKVVNVGSSNSVYNVSVTAPLGMTVSVFPPQLQFKSLFQTIGFQMKFTIDQHKVENPWLSGELTWISHEHSVRSVFAVSPLS